MAQYIDKSALVMEIESYKDDFCDRNGNLEDCETNGLVYDTLCKLEYFINTLEVKEVDLEKEIKEEYLKRRRYGGKDNMLVILNEPNFNRIAKHFFELGLKTQKGE